MLTKSESEIKDIGIAYILLQILSQYENMPIQIYRRFHHQKLKVFR